MAISWTEEAEEQWARDSEARPFYKLKGNGAKERKKRLEHTVPYSKPRESDKE